MDTTSTSQPGGAPPPPPLTERPHAFVADAETVGTPRLHGAWIDVSQSFAGLRRAVAAASAGHPFVVIDQIGFGPKMIDEETSLGGLWVRGIMAFVHGWYL